MSLSKAFKPCFMTEPSAPSLIQRFMRLNACTTRHAHLVRRRQQGGRRQQKRQSRGPDDFHGPSHRGSSYFEKIDKGMRIG
jgi:hypothetical protein